MSPEQCRHARDILKWTREVLAKAAGVSPSVVAAFEDDREVLPAHWEAIRATLESVGISFPFELENDHARAAGVTYSPLDRSETH